MSVPHSVSEAQRWLRFAQGDLAAAELSATTGDLVPHVGCFHAQQACEKSIKAISTFLQIPFPFRHDLDGLRNLVPAGWNVHIRHPRLGTMSQWATFGRYPGNWPEATDTDARNAAREARALWDTVLDDLDSHGLDVSAFR